MSNWKEALSELWAGTMENISLSLPLHRVVMTVRTVNSPVGRSQEAERTAVTVVLWYEVVFEGVVKFQFVDIDANPWTMTELTEIVTRKLNAKTEYSFELTGNEDALTIVCDDARVTFLQKDVTPRSAAI